MLPLNNLGVYIGFKKKSRQVNAKYMHVRTLKLIIATSIELLVSD